MSSRKRTEVLAGHVGVDSGVILVIDPSHAENPFTPADFDPLLEDPAMPVKVNGLDLAVGDFENVGAHERPGH